MPSSKLESNLSMQFPFEILKGAAGFFSQTHSEHFESPRHFFFMSYLTCLGALLSSRVQLMSSLKTRPRLYTVLLGESASDRKSTAIIEPNNLFKQTFGNDYSFCLGVGSAEGLQRIFKKSHAFKFPGTEKDDPINKFSLNLALDEFKAFVSKCKIKGSILLECVNSLFEMDGYENHTARKSLVLKNAHLSLIGASTIETYERIYSSNFIDIGFPNRIFLVVGTAEPKHSIPPPIPPQKIIKMKKDLEIINDTIGPSYKFKISDKAWAIYDNWYLNLPRNSIHSKRLDGYCLRIMMLLAANKLEGRITSEIAKDAIKLCDWEYEVRRVYDPIDADNNIARMEEKIRRHILKSGGTSKDYVLKQKTNANRTGLWIYGKALENLKTNNEIEWDKRSKTYRFIGD